MIYLELLAGFCLLLGCGDFFVRGAVGVAQIFRVSPLVIGLTLVGFGTSLPELVASLEAARIGSPGIAVGNVVGSNIANVLLILGLAAIIAPIAVSDGAFRLNGPVLIGVSLLALLVFFLGSIGRWWGLVFVLLLLGYTVTAYRRGRHDHDGTAVAQLPSMVEAAPQRHARLMLYGVLTAAGLLGIVLGADLLIDAAVVLARQLGVSETVIGLTVVAVGTSLPELATSVIAAVRRQPDVALGNVVGSNIFNILGILGVTALVHPMAVPAAILRFDGWVMLGAAALIIVFATTKSVVERWEGAILLGGYSAYLFVLFQSVTGPEAVVASLGS
ncbi:MAG: calcium/sodium antiporter [Kiloniellaceae bacterium]